MVTVRETKPGTFEPVAGNPTLTSLDGGVRAPLRTILHDSWSAEDRAAFGVHLVQEMAAPDGKRVTGVRYEKQGSTVVQVLDMEDMPEMPASEPSRYDVLRSDLEALAARVQALEGKR